MKVIVYPADDYGCGHHRMIWPATYLREAGYDVDVITTKDRRVSMQFTGDGQLVDVNISTDFDVIVFQRTTDFRLVQAVKWLRERGRTVVIDVDDDLSAIHPANPAFTFLDPHRAEHEVQYLLRHKMVDPRQAGPVLSGLKAKYTHSWTNLLEACRYASLVTVSTPGLRRRYGRNAVVLPNYLADHYYETEHEDSDLIGWPAALHSHPNDPAEVGHGLLRIVQDGGRFTTIGQNNTGIAHAFRLPAEPPCLPDVDILAWPAQIANLGIGIAPLADTRFNESKSWLKPLEMSAVGVPWVASPRTEYTNLHRLGAGLLAKDQRDWYRKLTMLRTDASARAELAQAGREVAAGLRLRDHAAEWWQAWELACAPRTPDQHPEPVGTY